MVLSVYVIYVTMHGQQNVKYDAAVCGLFQVVAN
jgi:hypothetical protein